MSGKVDIRRHRAGANTAECEDCDRLLPDSTRERCREHAARTGHTVRFYVEDVTIYTRKEPQR